MLNQFKLFLFMITASAIVSSCSKSSSSGPTTQTTSKDTVSTLAGSELVGAANGIGAAASFDDPYALAVSSSGLLYVSDHANGMIRTVDVNTAAVSTFAGTGASGLENGPAHMAKFYGPNAIAFDAAGNLFVADQQNNVIREITNTGTVTTVAGTGTEGYQDGSVASAEFADLIGLVVDASGNLYVSDNSNFVIRKINMTTGMVSTYAGVAGKSGHSDGALSSATFTSPCGMAIDASGNLFIVDVSSNCVRKINVSTGTVSTFAGSGAPGFVNGISSAATFNAPTSCAFDSQGNLYICDTNNHAIREITTAGNVITVAGTGAEGRQDGAALSATFEYPTGIAVYNSGIYIADGNGEDIRKITIGQ
jgi:serine/threonine-protein kinase